MTVSRRHHTAAASREIEVRGIVYEIIDSDNWADDDDMRDGPPDFLASCLLECGWFIDYRDPVAGSSWVNVERASRAASVALSCGGPNDWLAWSVSLPGYGQLASYGEPPWWVAFLTNGRDFLTELMLAGWVPSCCRTTACDRRTRPD